AGQPENSGVNGRRASHDGSEAREGAAPEGPAMDERSIFLAALERAGPAERGAYLDGAGAGGGELRRRIDGLLEAHDRIGSFLDRPAAGAQDTGAFTPSNGPTVDAPRPILEGPGTRIGPYKLLQAIGAGGMGAVFLAEQEQPVRRKVAL